MDNREQCCTQRERFFCPCCYCDYFENVGAYCERHNYSERSLSLWFMVFCQNDSEWNHWRIQKHKKNPVVHSLPFRFRSLSSLVRARSSERVCSRRSERVPRPAGLIIPDTSMLFSERYFMHASRITKESAHFFWVASFFIPVKSSDENETDKYLLLLVCIVAD